MRINKKYLLKLSELVEKNVKLTPKEIRHLIDFEKTSVDVPIVSWFKKWALPLSLTFGFLMAVFSENFEIAVKDLPSWTNMPPSVLSGVDYLWSLAGDPVEKANIIYHIPNIVLYAATFFGLKKIFEALEKHTWLDRVRSAQKTLVKNLNSGKINLSLKKGHSLLFVGSGDYIGTQFALNHKPSETITISHVKPTHTIFWNHYNSSTLYDDLKDVIVRSDGATAGEYIFFPVIDTEIFLPGTLSYDLSPHKLDIIIQDIRTVEREMKWKPKRIIVIGDTFHQSFVQSEDKNKVIPKTGETITIKTLAKKYESVTILDPTDIVLTRIIQIAKGRKIIFRATKEGIKEYKNRFYNRLKILGYRQIKTKKGVLTIGYDLFEDQTEQQTLSRTIDDYFPVVLSKPVNDALIRNGYKNDELLYVPDLVLQKLKAEAKAQ